MNRTKKKPVWVGLKNQKMYPIFYDDIDEEITDLVKYVNERGNGLVWTVNSCAGHKKCPETGMFLTPYLMLECIPEAFIYMYNWLKKRITKQIRISTGIHDNKAYIHPFILKIPDITKYKLWRHKTSIEIVIHFKHDTKYIIPNLSSLRQVLSIFVKEFIRALLRGYSQKKVPNELFR